MNHWKPLIFVSFFTVASVVNAAPITWNAVQNSSEESDVITTGELVEALNGAAGGGSILVNGVTFNDATPAPLVDGFASALNNSGATTGSASYDSLLNTFAFGGGANVSLNLDIGGDGLSANNLYLLQVWFTDLRPNSSGRKMIFGDGDGSTVTVDAVGTGLGQFAVGFFTADGSSQALTLATNGFSNVHLNAYQLRNLAPDDPDPVPAPATLALVGLGMMLLRRILTRRSRQV
ncbi:MAG: hypothetical protein ABR578_09925 [Chromatocurvus sp.]